MFVYLDNSSTTKTLKEVNHGILEVLEKDFGNPSSLHKMGVEIENKIEYARDCVAKALNVPKKCIYFTSGGTESDNLAIAGYLKRNKRKGNKIITTTIEHPAILNVVDNLEDCEVSYLSVNSQGNIDYEELSNLVDDKTAMVSIMQVNNETGNIFDLKKISEIVKSKNKETVVHTDGVQSFLKIPLEPQKMGVDMVSISSHKINGPKGVGALYVRDGLFLSPVLYGGGQEKALRNGTENTMGIYGFGIACEFHKKNEFDILKLKNQLLDGIKDIDRISINTNICNSAPHILNVSFIGLRSEIMLHTLEQFGIYVSSGSACSSNGLKGKKVLEKMGFEKEVFDSAIRFSLSHETTKEEIDYVIETVRREVSLQRKRLRV